MAVTAKFVADFSSFNQAVDRALGHLEQFQKGAQGAEKALGRMVDNFSGQKLIREATTVAAAVEAIGGASMLTSKELEHVGNTAKEAVEKLRLLGKDVPANLQELAKHAAASTKELGLMQQIVQKIGPQLVAAFSVGSILAFAKGIGTFAGELTDLAAETGISTDRLQELDYAAASVGLTIQDITTAVNQLSKRLAGDDKSAAAAVDQLKLNVVELQRLSPDEAFLAISRAITQIENPMERTRLAMELFGRSGAKMLRLMTDDVDGLIASANAAGAVIDKSIIKRADEFDDAWTQALKAVKAQIVTFIGEVARGWEELDRLRTRGTSGAGMFSGQGAATSAGTGLLDLANAAWQSKENDADIKWFTQRAARGGNLTFGTPNATAPKIGGALATMGVPNNIAEIEKDLKKIGAAAKDTSADIERLGEAYQAWMTKTRNAEGEALMKKAAASFSGIQSAIDAGQLAIQGLVPDLAAVGAVGKTATNEIERMAQALYNLPAAVKSAGDSAGVSTGGGGIFGKLFGGLQGGLSGLLGKFTGGEGISGIFSKIGTGIFEGFGNLISGGLSSAINAGMNLLGAGVSKLFGKLFKSEGKEVNNMRDQFIAAAGGIDVLAKKAMEAGTSVDRLLAAKKVKEFEAAVLELQDTMGNFAAQQEADQARLQAAIEKYAFTLEELGPALQKQKLDEQAQDLAEDWRVLMAAGVDVNAINQRMEESVMAYLEAAQSVGAEVPASMRPVLQSMLETGQLTDEAGNAFVSLDEAGITFASTLTDVVDKLDELIDKLEELGGFPSINVGVPGIPEGFARGTGGRYLDFGRGTPVMLHGRERVMTEGEGRGESAVVSAVNGLRTELVRTVRQVAMAGRDANLIAAGRTV